MRKAWIENDRIRDIAPEGNPEQFYHPDIAKFYDTDVPDDAANGDGWVNGELVKPVAPEPITLPAPVVVPPKVSPVEFKLLFTSAERIAIKAARATDPVLEDGYEILEDSRLTHVDLGLASVQGLIDYMVTKALLSAERAAQVKAGELQ